MPDPKNMSIDEIVAYCRQADGDGSSPEPAEAESAAEAPAAPAPKASSPPAKMDPSKMSVEDMLAAARGESAGGAAAETEEEEAEEEAPAATGPAEKLDPSKMSVEDMLAAARGQTKAAPAKKAKKPAAKKAPAKAAGAKSKGAAKSDEPLDTASVLAAARKSAKRGPISKAEAAERAKGDKKKSKPAPPPMPEKPAYAQATAPAPADDAEDRRGFIASVMGAFMGSAMAIGFSSLSVTNILWTLGLARFMFPNILIEPPTRFKVGFPDDYAPGQVQAKFKAQFGVWIVRFEYEGQLQIYALKSVCTHLGCTPNWLEGEQKFKCPCHGSGFYKDGVNFEGPAPRPLERYAIRLADDGQLEVDKSRKFNEELGQWKDGASFVSV